MGNQPADGGRVELGLGIGWRAELALPIERYPGLGFVEVLAEDLDADAPLPAPLRVLAAQECRLVVHGISLSLGGAERPDARRLRRLARLAERCGAPFVSEHLAFVRAGGQESGHLLPLPFTRKALTVVCENIRIAQDQLPVPLALENISTLFEWPGGEMEEADFLCEVLERTGALLLLDVSNVYANARNHRWEAERYLDRIPLERIAYVHVGGGHEHGGIYYDTHADPIPIGALELLQELCARTGVPGVMLERDDRFPSDEELYAELDAIARSVRRGSELRDG